MKKLVIELGQVNFDIAENILKNFSLNKENSHRYSFEYDNEDEEEVEASNEFENEISILLVQNNISFKIKREFVIKKEERIKLVVVNENTIGYINPKNPNCLCILHASILKGSIWNDNLNSVILSKKDKIRLASKKDFDEYNISMEGYNEKEYEFIID